MNFLSATPESQGMDSAQVAEFVRGMFAEIRPYVHSVLVMRHGRIVAEAYRGLCSPADRHQLFSLSKSFTSTAVGIAIGEGLLSLDDTVVSFFPEAITDRVSDRMRRVRVRDLLSMQSGRASCGIFNADWQKLDARPFADDRPWIAHLLENALEHEPGTRFVYDTSATYTLSAIIRRVTGAGLIEYLRPRFFEPVGIGADIVWDRDPEGLELGGWGLNLSTREIARAAQVWLHYGKAPGGRQLIPEEYMRLATSKVSQNHDENCADWRQGYGFQFWRCQHGCFRGDGASGQLAVMIPEHDAVVAVTAGIVDMQRELDMIWNRLLPAFRESAMPGNPTAFAGLRAVEAAPQFDFGPEGRPAADVEPFSFEAARNVLGVTSVSFRQMTDGVLLDFKYSDGSTEAIRAGFDAPQPCALAHIDPLHVFAAWGRAHWPKPETLELRLAVPTSTSFFTMTLDIISQTLHVRTPIWFARHWKSDVTLSSRTPAHVPGTEPGKPPSI